MAIKEMASRNLAWFCRDCEENNLKLPSGSTNQTTKSAEQHADQNKHRIIAIGQITYDIRPGQLPDDDPFDPDQRR